MQATDRFVDRLRGPEPLVVPGCFDALSAALAAEAGFDAVLVSGFGVAASLLGRPDVELYTQTEMATVCRHVCRRVAIAVMADADNGYGNALNVMRTVAELESAGVSSITIEDQDSPKRCPLLGKSAGMLAVDEAAGKIRAAVAARRNPGMAIIARTDAIDEEEVLARTRAYAAAGADAVKLISPAVQSLDMLRLVRQACGLPIMIASLGWAATVEPIYLRGLAGAITHPLMPLASAAAALQANLRALREGGGALPAPALPLDRLEQLLGMDEVRAHEQAYLPG